MKSEDDFTSWRHVLRESVAGFLIGMGIVAMVLGAMAMVLSYTYG
jgi:hypothetical protein